MINIIDGGTASRREVVKVLVIGILIIAGRRGRCLMLVAKSTRVKFD